MKYKIERFKNREHEQNNRRDKHVRPYRTSEKTFSDQDELLGQLKAECRTRKDSRVFRVTPMQDPFTVEVDVEVVVTARTFTS